MYAFIQRHWIINSIFLFNHYFSYFSWQIFPFKFFNRFQNSIQQLNIILTIFHRKQERNTWNQSVKDESRKVLASRVLSRVACSRGSRESWFQRWKSMRRRRKKRKERGGRHGPVDILVMPEARWGEEAEANSPLPRRRKAWSVPLLCLRLLLSSAVSLAVLNRVFRQKSWISVFFFLKISSSFVIYNQSSVKVRNENAP